MAQKASIHDVVKQALVKDGWEITDDPYVIVYFCTCDDRFLWRAKTIGDLKTGLVTPLELVEELDL